MKLIFIILMSLVLISCEDRPCEISHKETLCLCPLANVPVKTEYDHCDKYKEAK